jgi:plastocyanin
MNIRVALINILLATLLAACEGNPAASESLTPVGPSPVAADHSASSGTQTMQGREDVTVNMLDACDPDTFNAPPLEPGTCVRSGGVTFPQFIAELTRLGFIGPWRFSPSTSNVEVGQTFVAINRGGEVHTFTEVATFGGGRVPPLNELAGVPDITPECAALQPGGDDFVPAGGTFRAAIDRTGSLKFQCCIHPWMRLEASSR